MKPNKKNPFGVLGLVHPDEYDWKGQFHRVALRAYEDCEVIVPFDVGKVMGLADAYDELLQEYEELKGRMEGLEK